MLKTVDNPSQTDWVPLEVTVSNGAVPTKENDDDWEDDKINPPDLKVICDNMLEVTF